MAQHHMDLQSIAIENSRRIDARGGKLFVEEQFHIDCHAQFHRRVRRRDLRHAGEIFVEDDVAEVETTPPTVEK